MKWIVQITLCLRNERRISVLSFDSEWDECHKASHLSPYYILHPETLPRQPLGCTNNNIALQSTRTENVPTTLSSKDDGE